MTKYLDFLP